MSMLLINFCGLVACRAVLVIGAKSVHRAYQILLAEEDYLVELPLEDRNKTADIVGLGVKIVGYGVITAVDVVEKQFSSLRSHWLRTCLPLFSFKQMANTLNIEMARKKTLQDGKMKHQELSLVNSKRKFRIKTFKK